jgi:hypothetical protein
LEAGVSDEKWEQDLHRLLESASVVHVRGDEVESRRLTWLSGRHVKAREAWNTERDVWLERFFRLLVATHAGGLISGLAFIGTRIGSGPVPPAALWALACFTLGIIVAISALFFRWQEAEKMVRQIAKVDAAIDIDGPRELPDPPVELPVTDVGQQSINALVALVIAFLTVGIVLFAFALFTLTTADVGNAPHAAVPRVEPLRPAPPAAADKPPPVQRLHRVDEGSMGSKTILNGEAESHNGAAGEHPKGKAE